jgi:hypothetical protein
LINAWMKEPLLPAVGFRTAIEWGISRPGSTSVLGISSRRCNISQLLGVDWTQRSNGQGRRNLTVRIISLEPQQSGLD